VIVLDTHALVWWVADPRRVPSKARRSIDGARSAGMLAVSSMSLWEIAMLAMHGRLELAVDSQGWINRVEALPFLTFVPVDNRIAVSSVHLELPHRDPADRIIAATAIALGATLVTGDARIRACRAVQTLWD
jgi:PIN domain nuclease of toxin-antitoxin system